MTYDEFRLALLVEQFGQPTPEWHPTQQQRAASDRRTEVVDDALHEQRAAS